MASVTIPGVDGAAALAEVANDQLIAGGAADMALAAELVPETPTFISDPVVQPLADSADAPVFIQSFEVDNLKTLSRLTSIRLVQLFGAGQIDRSHTFERWLVALPIAFIGVVLGTLFATAINNRSNSHTSVCLPTHH